MLSRFVSSNSSICRHATRSASTITKIHSREVIDSRGNPTVEVDLWTDEQYEPFRAIVPSGASTGMYEACELRDGGSRYMGKGVKQAVTSVNDVLAKELIGMDVVDQQALDDKMIKLDGTANKTNLGANAILGVSMAASRAGAATKRVPLYKHFADLAGNPNPNVLPVPCFNVVNGGEHAGNKLAFQEFFVIPTGASSFKEAMQIGCEVFHNLKKVIKAKFGGDATLIGDEGGFAPPCTVDTGLAMIAEATEMAGYSDKVTFGLDVAASEFKVDGKDLYDLDFKTPEDKRDASMLLSGDELLNKYVDMCDKYPVVTVEDAFDQNDWENWTKLNKAIGERIQIVGDDLTVTNPDFIRKAIETDAANALLLKVNQIGTITESIDAVKLSKQNGWGVMCSHRSGETEDTTIADLAVGLCTGEIKTGAPCRGERTAKYEELGSSAVYPGINFRNPGWMG